ncbi:MAG: tRNA glutamyl-Q(34) synthetase GluQRS [Hyphomicrobiales bacterium]|nr:tRNA glutamyl-Q(34) synthetase GluQRS [Hyphomicrobiales bacterium]
MRPPVFRFAPSPNGYLHLGHALSALLNHDMARAGGGALLLRIEDIDRTRCRPHYEQAIVQDLTWLGIAWEQPVRRQSEHLEDYRAALARLQRERLIYPSFESRAEIAALLAARQRERAHAWPRDPDGVPLYPVSAASRSAAERRQRMAPGEPCAWRLDMAAAIDRVGPLTWTETGQGPDGETGNVTAAPAAWGDVLLARKDIPTSYHLSVVIDDALQGVSHVVRGSDLFFATGIHRLLQALLGLPVPLYHHHRLVLDEEGRKLSKSSRATGLRALRAAGATAADIRRMVGLA